MSKTMSEQMQKVAERYEKATGKKFGQKTNADRIRAMSDEELAEWIVFTNTMCECCADLHRCDGPRSHIRCGKGIRNWLKQPCKEET